MGGFLFGNVKFFLLLCCMKSNKKPKYDNYDVDIEPFIEITWQILLQYKKSYGYTQDRLKWLLDRALRFATDGVPKFISKKVADIFIIEYPNENPFLLRYDIRYRFGEVFVNTKRKSRLLLEHTTPVGEVINKIIKVNTRQEVSSILMNYSGVCVVTRDEDITLNKNGFSKKRNNDWNCAYKTCNIETLTEQEFEHYRSIKKIVQEPT